MFPGAVLATNVIFTSLIVGRLVYHQRNLKKFCGARSNPHYTSIATVIIESASVNIVFQTLALGTAKNDILNSLFNINLLGQTQASSNHSMTKYLPIDIFRTGVCNTIDHLPRCAREGVDRANVAQDDDADPVPHKSGGGPRQASAELGRLQIIEDKDGE